MNYKEIIKSDLATTVQTSLSRRQFIKLSTVSGFALGMASGCASTADKLSSKSTLAAHKNPTEFIQVGADGQITIQINRLEFGQGTHTGLARVLADELDADWNHVTAELAPVADAFKDPVAGRHFTGGSTALKHSYQQYRELGARARQMFVSAAAQQWGVKPDQILTKNSILTGPDQQSASYAEMAAAAMTQPIPSDVILKSASEFNFIGKPAGRLDAEDKSTGKQIFGIDARLPNQKTVLIARPPLFGGTVLSFDASKAKAMSGVSAVLKVDLDRNASGVAIVANSYWQAKVARDALNIEWQAATSELPDSERMKAEFSEMLNEPGLNAEQADLSSMSEAAKTIQADYYFPFLAHAAMEPINALMQVTGSGAEMRAELWTGAQSPGRDQAAVAAVLGLQPSQVSINVMMTGGGFGRRSTPSSDIVSDTARVMKAWLATGNTEPLKVVWSREDDMRGGYYRPLNMHRAEVAVDDRGDVLAWKHNIVCPSIFAGTPFEAFVLKNGIDGSATEGVAKSAYKLPINLDVHHPKSDVPILWWRSVGHTHTAFVMETMIDRLAANAKADPVAFRRNLLVDQPRHLAALDLVVEKSGYGQLKLAAGHAWGVAVHESFDSVVAHIVDVSIEDNKPKVHKISSGVHCNLAVNPKSVIAQIEGAALMGLSTTLEGSELVLKDGKVVQSNFHDYAVARMSQMPEMDVHIVPSADAPTGVGEPGLPPVAPAIANAVFALTGEPVTSLPIKLA